MLIRYYLKEYRVIYPEEKQIELYTLKDKTLGLSGTFAESDKLTLSVMNGFSFNLQSYLRVDFPME